MTAAQALSDIFEAAKALYLIDQQVGEQGTDAAHVGIVLEFKAHEQILRSVRALRAAEDNTLLQKFEAAYLNQLSAFCNPNDLLEGGVAWMFANIGAATEVRSRLISSVMALCVHLQTSLTHGTCPVASQLCAELAEWLRDQPSVGEESLTDWLLFQLRKRSSRRVLYHKCTRYEESRVTGADWEWWFVGNSKNFAIRVQAKKLSHDDFYPQLAYSNRRGLQIEMLLDSARHQKMLPFYVLYYAPQSVPKVRCDGQFHTGLQGAFLADAIELYDKWVKVGRQRLDAARVIADSSPLSCLFCCAATMAADDGPLFEKIHAWIRQIYPVAVNATPDQGIHEGLPGYVRALLQSSDERPWIEMEFSDRLRDVGALLVFDLRTERESEPRPVLKNRDSAER